MLKKIALIVAVLLIGLLAFAATKPDSFRVERSATIQAPPEQVYAYLDDFHRWGAWSPWEKLDPQMTRTHSGAASGQGAVYEWSGNSEVGRGRMEITEASPPGKLFIKLEFREPFEAHNTTEFTLVPEGGATKLNWAMYGPNNYVSKLMQVFMDMDQMIGKDFEAGLANLKSLAEREAVSSAAVLPQ
ncbi:MAG: SRPBCC family protein [Gammaproteobacteria bacterium]|nr:SRPBCC family protein [Gammaproteobacteria bacterium]